MTISLPNKELPPLDYELIIAHILQKSREYVLAHPEISLNPEQEKKCKEFVQRRLKGEPLAYILGHKEFYGLDFLVNNHVLIPRPETELMVEQALKLIEKNCQSKSCIVIDVGTGSGCIPVSIAKHTTHIKTLEIMATDISEPALEVARSNAAKHQVSNKITFLKSNLLSSLPATAYPAGSYVLITANLPYISEKLYQASPVSVKEYEPPTALISGKDGLDHYRRLISQISELKNNGILSNASVLLEISPEQHSDIQTLIKSALPSSSVRVFKDLAQKWRLVEIVLP